MSDDNTPDMQIRIHRNDHIGAALLRYLDDHAVSIEYEMGEWKGWHVWHWRGNPSPSIRPIPCATVDEAIRIALAKAAENATKPRSAAPTD